MVAFQHNKSIFYRAFREIPSGTELLVWYDDNYYLQHMGIPVGNWTKDISQHFPGEIFLKKPVKQNYYMPQKRYVSDAIFSKY